MFKLLAKQKMYYILKHLNTRTLLFGVLMLVSISLIFSTVKVVQKNYSLQQQVDNLASEVSLLELENENLQLGIAYYNTDAFLELEARKKFNKVAHGEKVIALPRDGDGVLAASTEAKYSDDQKPQYAENFDEWFHFLFQRQ